MNIKNKAEKKERKNIIIAALVMCFLSAGLVSGIHLTNDSSAKEADKKPDTDKKVVAVVDNDSKKSTQAKTAEESTTSKETQAVKKEQQQNTAKQPKKQVKSQSTTAKKSSSNSGSSSNKKPASKPKHTHSWTAKYGSRSVPYTVTEHYQVTVCSDCGIEKPSTSHSKEHIMNGQNGGRKEVTRSRTVTKYRTERYVTGYKCSCGATK